MKPKHKKGVIPAHLLVEIMTGVIIVLILLLGFKTFGAMKEKTREATSLQTEERMKSDIETIALRVGSSQRGIYDIPEGVNQVCFIDRSIDIALIPLANEYPIIHGMMDGDPDVNMFLIYSATKIESLSIGPICIPPFPHYLCFNTTAQKLDLILEGSGNCTIIWNILDVEGMNLKNLEKYEDAAFIVSDPGEDKKHLLDVLRLIPLAIWKEGESDVFVYPLLVMHEAVTASDREDYLEPLDNNIVYEKLVFFGYDSDPRPDLIKDETFVEREHFDNYFTYWLDYDEIVVMHEDHADSSGIKAALFAAYINAPLIFVNKDNVINFRNNYRNKKVYIFESIHENIRKEIENNAREVESHPISYASNPGVNPLLQLSSEAIIDLSE